MGRQSRSKWIKRAVRYTSPAVEAGLKERYKLLFGKNRLFLKFVNPLQRMITNATRSN